MRMGRGEGRMRWWRCCADSPRGREERRSMRVAPARAVPIWGMTDRVSFALPMLKRRRVMQATTSEKRAALVPTRTAP